MQIGVAGVAFKKELFKRDSLTADGTEQTVLEATGLGLFEGYIDLANMQLGDAVVIRKYVKIVEGGNFRLYAAQTYGNVQAEPMIHFLPQMVDQGIQITMQQTAGIFKKFPYVFFKET